MKHTPGPWSLEDINSEHLHDVVLVKEIPGAGWPVLVATVFFDEDRVGIPLEEATGNAYLIASAPDLLAALEAIAGWASDEGPLAGSSPMQIAEYARTVVAKAKGGKDYAS